MSQAKNETRRLLTAVVPRCGWRIMAVLLCFQLVAPALIAQSRQAERGRIGANLTFVVYQYDEAKSSKIEDQVRFSQTFDRLEDEQVYLKKTLGLEGLEARHLRSVGLIEGEAYREGAFMSGDTLELEVKVLTVTRGAVTLEWKIKYGDTKLLEVSRVEVHNFETVAMKGGRGRFGVRTFAGPKGNEQARAEATLLVTVTPVIVPLAQLRNRPREISYPCDEYGRPVEVNNDDVFFPPVIAERVVPKFPTRRVTPSILVEGVVTPDGRVTNVRVLRTFDSELNSFAVDAFKGYKVLPARLNGQPVHATLREEVGFQARP
jgi:hypothetical protein